MKFQPEVPIESVTDDDVSAPADQKALKPWGGGDLKSHLTVTDADSCRMTAKWALFPLPKEAWCCERHAA